MGMGQRYKMGPSALVGATPVYLNGTRKYSAKPQNERYQEITNGSIDPSVVALIKRSEMMEISTVDIRGALAALGFDPVKIASGATYTSFDQYFVQVDPNGKRKSGSVHTRIRQVFGLVCAQKLSWQIGNKPAMLEMQAHAAYDTTNDPWAINTAVALPASGKLTEIHRGGPVFLQGSRVNGVQSVEIAFTSEVERATADHYIYDLEVSFKTRKPIFTIVTKDLSYKSVYTEPGVAASADLDFYFAKVAHNGHVVGNATAEHIKVTAKSAQAYIQTEEIEGSEFEDNTLKIVVVPSETASNAVLSISTSAALP